MTYKQTMFCIYSVAVIMFAGFMYKVYSVQDYSSVETLKARVVSSNYGKFSNVIVDINGVQQSASVRGLFNNEYSAKVGKMCNVSKYNYADGTFILVAEGGCE